MGVTGLQSGSYRDCGRASSPPVPAESHSHPVRPPLRSAAAAGPLMQAGCGMSLVLHGLAAYLSGTTTLTPEVDMTGDTARTGADGATPLKTREVLRVTIDSIALAALEALRSRYLGC